MMMSIDRRVTVAMLLSFLTSLPLALAQETAPSDPANNVDLYLEAMKYDVITIRENAANRLSQMPEKPFDKLVNVLAKGSKREAVLAALVITKLKAPDADIPQATESGLYDILNNPATEDWRWNIAATLLTRIAADNLKDHVDLWIMGVNHPSPLLPLPSLWALGKTGDAGKPAEESLARLLARPHAQFANIAWKATNRDITDNQISLEEYHPDYEPLFILETMVAIKADPKLMVAPLMRLTQHDNQYIRLDAARLLANLDVEMLPSDPRPHAAMVLAELAGLSYGKVRETAVMKLGEMGPSAAGQLKVLIALLKDDNVKLRIAAANSLGEIGAAAAPALKDLMEARRFSELDTQDAATAIDTAIQKIEDAVQGTMTRLNVDDSNRT